MSTGQNHPRDYMKYCLFLAQEILLDNATTGKEARDRLTSNAKLLKNTLESWITYCNWNPHEMIKEVYANEPEANQRQRERDRTKGGRGRARK